MTATTAALIGLIALCAAFDFTNGFHDSADSVAVVIATRVMKPRWAVLWAAFWNFVAFLVFGTAVANTVAETVKAPMIGLALIFAALVGAIGWNLLSWHLGLPTSSSHALIGGLVGAALVRGGWSAISSSNLEKTAAFVVISPVAGLVIAAVVMGGLRWALRRRDTDRVERHFRRAQLVSSAAVSLGHGGNDAQKTMGVVAALLVATHHLTGGSKLAIPLWVVLLAHASIAVGTYFGGWRIIRTLGGRITELHPVSGFAAETSAAVALFTSTMLGAPVSTTHTVTGAVSGAGLANRNSDVDWSVFGRVGLAWVFTMPVAAAIAALGYVVTTELPAGLAAILIVLGLAVTAVLVARSLRSAPGADDIEDDLGGDDREASDTASTPDAVSAPL